MTTDSEEAAHAPLAPSSSERWIACPGSVLAEYKIREESGFVDDSNEHSRLGTLAHEVLELCLRWGYKPENFLGAKLCGDDHPAVDNGVVIAVRTAIEYVHEYLDTYGRENVRLRVEHRVPIGKLIGVSDKQCNGTADVILEHLDGSMAVTMDYKNGSGVKVDARENSQAKMYSLGASRLRDDGKFKKYRCVIIQPRAAKRRPVDSWETTHAQLMRWARNTVAPSAQAALQPNAPRNAGEHCLWCKAKGTCRTFRAKARAVAAAEFDPIPDPDDAQDIRPDEYPRILEEANVLELWLRAARAHALKLLQAGETIPGYQLGWTKRRREWDDEAGATDFCERKALHVDDYMPRTLLSPAKLTALLKAKKIIPRQKASDDGPPPNPLDAFIRLSIPHAKIEAVDAAGGEFDAYYDEEDENEEI